MFTLVYAHVNLKRVCVYVWRERMRGGIFPLLLFLSTVVDILDLNISHIHIFHIFSPRNVHNVDCVCV